MFDSAADLRTVIPIGGSHEGLDLVPGLPAKVVDLLHLFQGRRLLGLQHAVWLLEVVGTYRSAKKATLKRGTQLEYFKKGNRDGYSGIRKRNGRAGGESFS